MDGLRAEKMSGLQKLVFLSDKSKFIIESFVFTLIFSCGIRYHLETHNIYGEELTISVEKRIG